MTWFVVVSEIFKSDLISIKLFMNIKLLKEIVKNFLWEISQPHLTGHAYESTISLHRKTFPMACESLPPSRAIHLSDFLPPHTFQGGLFLFGLGHIVNTWILEKPSKLKPSYSVFSALDIIQYCFYCYREKLKILWGSIVATVDPVSEYLQLNKK